jgi:phage minor structural protein
MLILYDINHNKIGALTNYKDYYIEQAVNIDDLLYFSYPIADPQYPLIAFECYIRNEGSEYIVKEINAQGAKDGIEWAQFVCRTNLEDLKGHLITNFETIGQLPGISANLALAGTGWIVGYCNVSKLRTVRKAQCTVYDVMAEIATAYACEITYNPIHKTVAIYQKQGADRGAYFAEQLNLQTLQSQSNTNDYITRLVPIGANNLDITSVNDGVNYVSNYQYSDKVITGYWIDNRYTSNVNLVALNTALSTCQVDATAKDSWIEGITSDNKLTGEEKSSISTEMAAITSELAVNDTQATALDVITEKTSYDDTYYVLNTYITPLIADTGVETTISGDECKQKFDFYYLARIALLTAFVDKAKIKIDVAAQTLLDDAVDRLAYLSKPTCAYAASIVDLANVSDTWGLLDFALGDFIALLSESKNVREQQRIVKINRYPEEPERSTIQIANRIARLEDIILRVSDAANTVATATNTTGSVVASSVSGDLTNAHIAAVNVDNLSATIATIGTLIATKAIITELTAVTADIETLTADKANVTDLTASTARITTLEADSATITQLAVSTARITTLEATTAHITNGIIDNATINVADINNLSANFAHITSGVIDNAVVGLAAIGTTQIADGSITDGKIVTLSANKISAGTIDAAVITVNHLNAANITVGTINGSQISNGAITTANILDGTILGGDITPGTITNTLISANTITGDKLIVDAITAREIASKVITANEIVANTITAAQIAANTITANEISANTITATQILAYTITATQIAAYTITASKIAAGAITADMITAGTMSANRISGGTITGITLTGVTITAKDTLNVNGSGGWASLQLTSLQGKLGSIYANDQRGLNFQTDTDYQFASSGTVNTVGNIHSGGEITAVGNIWSNGGICPYSKVSAQIIELEHMTGGTPPSYLQITLAGGGTVYGATTWASDKSLKNNIQDMTETALAKIMLIKHRQFDWKKEHGGAHCRIGYVSQELLEIDESMAFEVEQGEDVKGNKKPSLYQPNETVIIPMLSKAIQELKKEFDAFKIASFKAK